MTLAVRPPHAAPAELRSEKVRPWHRDRLAAVYVRQSTPQQVLEHRESTRLQYGLADRARALGWSAERVLVIDDDLGKSAASAEGRAGFQRLVSEVSLDTQSIIGWAWRSPRSDPCLDWPRALTWTCRPRGPAGPERSDGSGVVTLWELCRRADPAPAP
jgi:hypothetical protein